MTTITRLSLANIKKNRSRSGLIILSIGLTTMFLMAIATFGNGIIKTNKANAAEIYGAYYGSYRSVTKAQLSNMKLRSEFTDIGIRANCGIVEGDKDLSLMYTDTKTQEIMHMEKQLADGKYPADVRDITAPEGFFVAAGVKDPKVGEKVTLACRADKASRYAPEEFVIAGILKDTGTASAKEYAAYVSKDYYESSVPDEQRLMQVYFSLDKNPDIRLDTVEDEIRALAKKCDIDVSQVSTNNGYLMWTLDPGTQTIAGCAAVALLVVVLSVIVILNIFQISVVQRIQEYGKIKAIGATKKQMKRLVFGEGMILALLGLPFGLLLGTLLGDGMIRLMIRLSDEIGTSGINFLSGFSPALLLLVACVTLLTVWIAIRRPIRSVSRISPVEAMKYQELTKGAGRAGSAGRDRKKGKSEEPSGGSGRKVAGKKEEERRKHRTKKAPDHRTKKIPDPGIRKGHSSLGVAGLTMANLYANKKRTISTMVTMGLSCVIFIVMANLAGNMDAAYDARYEVEHGDIKLDLDYDLGDTAYPENNLDHILRDNPMNEALLDKIRQTDGVTNVRTGDILLLRRDGSDGYDTVTVMDREEFQREAHRGTQKGNIDYDDAVRHHSIIHGWSEFMDEDGVKLGDKLTGTLSNGVKEIEFESRIPGAFGSSASDYIITKDTYQSLHLPPSTGRIWITCAKGTDAAVERQVRELISDTSRIELSTYKDALKTSEAGIFLIKTMSYAGSALLAVISFMNMANTLITSIVTRKREFGVLQAIGMTNKQLNRSLRLEGSLLTLGTVLVSFAIGTPLGYALFFHEKKRGLIGLNIYHFPWPELLLLVAFLVLIQGLVSWILSRNVKRESLIDRIRYQG